MKIKLLPTGPLSVNTYYVLDESSGKGFIVDPGGYDPRLTQEIHKDNVTVDYIILTHGHGDHIGGVEGYQKDFPHAKVVASVLEKSLLADPNVNMSTMTMGKPISIVPDIAVEDGDTLTSGNMELKFLSTPGHSPGSMCVYTGNALFSGDTLFQGSIGRTDFPGGSFEQLKEGVHQKLFVLPDETEVYPGHMGTTTIGHEKENNPFV
ncbi:MAG: MBL fold metallo-hydrolase [Anaerovoracaceae bacterium]